MQLNTKATAANFFLATFGFQEVDYETTRQQLLDLAQFESQNHGGYPREKCDFMVNSETISAGIFSMPSVAELEQEVTAKLLDSSRNNNNTKESNISVKNMVGEARSLHTKIPGAVIQAASQFNMLEFPSPDVTPELGISDYIYDRTQGPACAVACAAGTAYRNYLVPIPVGDSNGTRRGQTQKDQLNGLADIEKYVMQHHSSQIKTPPWRVENGYTDSTSAQISPFNRLLQGKEGAGLKNKLESLLRVGVQEDTAITDFVPGADATCTQVYASAISIGYSRLPSHLWEPMARLVLNATYKATLLVGILKALEAQGIEEASKPILLTKVGAGVFGNKDEWVVDAISMALASISKYNTMDLDIRIVHFGSIDNAYRHLEVGTELKVSRNEL